MTVASPTLQLTTSSPLRGDAAWETSTFTVRGAVVYNPATGASRWLTPVSGRFVISAKTTHALSRPRGLSLAHWRKVRRDRRAHR